jgi:hypothetical protein
MPRKPVSLPLYQSVQEREGDQRIFTCFLEVPSGLSYSTDKGGSGGASNHDAFFFTRCNAQVFS